MIFIIREFSLALDLGCGRGHIGKQLDRELVHTLIQTDYSIGHLVSQYVYKNFFLALNQNICVIITTACTEQ